MRVPAPGFQAASALRGPDISEGIKVAAGKAAAVAINGRRERRRAMAFPYILLSNP
jgi:hypothetical protein